MEQAGGAQWCELCGRWQKMRDVAGVEQAGGAQQPRGLRIPLHRFGPHHTASHYTTPHHTTPHTTTCGHRLPPPIPVQAPRACTRRQFPGSQLPPRGTEPTHRPPTNNNPSVSPLRLHWPLFTCLPRSQRCGTAWPPRASSAATPTPSSPSSRCRHHPDHVTSCTLKNEGEAVAR